MRIRTIFAGIGAGNYVDPALNPTAVIEASTEEVFAPASNLSNVYEMGEPWQSTDGTKAEIRWHYGGSQVRASAFNLCDMDAHQDGRVTLELWSGDRAGVGTKVYSIDRVPIWFAYMAPTSSYALDWGTFLWGGVMPDHVRRNYPKNFLHVVMSSDGSRPQNVGHRSGRYIFEMETKGEVSPLGYWRASYLDVSEAYMPTRPMELEWKRGRKRIGTPPVEGPSGVVRAVGGSSKRTSKITFRALPRDEVLHNFETLQAEFGIDRPFVVIPDPGFFFEDPDVGTHQPTRADRWIFEAGLWRLQKFFDTKAEPAFGLDRTEPLWTVGTMDLEEWV